MARLILPYTWCHCPAPGPDIPALVAEGLTVRYPGSTAPALVGLSVRIPAGARVALVGPNGAGKSTFLKTAAGLLRPCAGTLAVFGRPPGCCRRLVAYLPQRAELDWRFPISVRRLVLTGRYAALGWFRRPGRQDRAAVATALARMGLTGLADCPIGRLSGGQQQRVLLARMLVQEASLLLLDEPLTAVDAETRTAVLGVLDELAVAGRTCVVATHDPDLGDTCADTVIRLPATAPTVPRPAAVMG
jgi:ABC-type Mn2+/Zn2+ transport system ATPase subunit